MKKQKSKSDEIAFFKKLGGDALVQEVRDYEARLAQSKAASNAEEAPWMAAGDVLDFKGHEGGMRLECLNGFVDLQWMTADCLRVWFRQKNEFEQAFSYAVVEQDRPIIKYELVDADTHIEMRTAAVTCHVQFAPFRLSLHGANGQVLCQTTRNMRFQAGGAVAASWALQPDESSYGMGERATNLNLRGQRFSMWNYDQPDCNRGTDPLYYCVPLYVGVHRYGAYGVFWDNSYRGFADVGADEPDELTFQTEGGDLRYYLIGGDDVLHITSQFMALTGKAPLPPLWYLGYQQSRFSYRSSEEVLAVARELRERNIPCDVIHLDIHYMDAFKVFTWDPEHFQDLPEMISELHSSGFKVISIVDPGIKIQAGYEAFESGQQAGVFLMDVDGEPLRVVVWPGACYMPDFTMEQTRQWWVEQSQRLIEAGVDGFWNDMNEPAVFATTGAVTLPEGIPHSKEGRGGSHLELHNVYGMQMARASRAALETYRPGKRQVNITRAGFAGAQRYASFWTGDVSSDWDHLKLSIPMVLNMGLSGVPFTGPDVGGFREDTTAELLTRWTQAACLMPFFRNHSALDTVRQEPWSFGQPYEDAIRQAIELRYHLMPYLYSVAAQAHEYGLPMVRPLFVLDPEDTLLREIDNQFMLGDALMVAPVVEKGATQREVMLPGGDWFDFWTNDWYEGGGTVVMDAPLDYLPLFVRGGAALPLWDVHQHLDAVKPETLTMRVYPGNLEMVLYEDAGEGLDYQNGDYRWLYMSATWMNNRLRLQRRIAGAYTPPYKNIRVQIMGFDEEPFEVKVDRQGAPVWFYEDGRVELNLADFSQIEVTRMIDHDDETIPRRRY